MPRISQLPAITEPANDDELAIVDSSGAITAKVTRGNLLAGTPATIGDLVVNDTVSLPAGSLETADYGNGSVTGQKLDAASSEYFTFTPAGNTDYTTTSWGDWITTSLNLTVPTWATKARVQVSINAFYVVSAVGSYNARLQIGTATGKTIRLINASSDASEQESISWADEITLAGTGAQAVIIEAIELSGSGTLRIDSNGTLSMIVTYHP